MMVIVTDDQQAMPPALVAWAALRRAQVAWGPLSVLETVRADLERRGRAGEIDPDFAREHLQFDFERASATDGYRRVLVVATPRPAHLVTFSVDGRRVEAILPPTYERYQPTFEDVRDDLLEHGIPGSRVEVVKLPLKLLAARLGLVRYGRNNLTYAPSMGSYLQLLGYLTDADLPVDPGWQPCEPRLLDDCERCGICEAVCPTAAIVSDRVLLHAERCLTLASETAGAWPAWVPLTAVDCLVGCLRCQQSCPANAEMPIVQSGVTFTEDETAALIAGRERDERVWPGIHGKLDRLGLSAPEWLVIGRNLRALVQQPGAGPEASA